jgi:hypothetical protein
VEVLELVGLAEKVAVGVKVAVGEVESVGEMEDTGESLSSAVTLAEPVAEGDGLRLGVEEAHPVAVVEGDTVAVSLSLSVVVTLGVEVAEAEPLALSVELPGVPLAVLVTVPLAQAVALCDTLPEPPGALGLTESVGDCVCEELCVALLAPLMEGEAEKVALMGEGEVEREGERVEVWQGEVEREAVGVTVPVAVPLAGVAVGEEEAEALTQLVGLLVALPVTVLPPVRVAVALGVWRADSLGLVVTDTVGVSEAEALGLLESLDCGVTVRVGAPVMEGVAVALGLRVEVWLAVAVEDREKVGVAVAVGVLKLPGEGVTRRLPVARREPVVTGQGVAGAETVKLEERLRAAVVEGAGEVERVKVLLSVAPEEGEAVLQALVVEEALVVAVPREEPLGPGSVMVPQAEVVGEMEAVREGEEETLGEGEAVAPAPPPPPPSPPLGLGLEVLEAVMGLAEGVVVEDTHTVGLWEKEALALEAGERESLGLAVGERLLRVEVLGCTLGVEETVAEALPVPTPPLPPGETVLQLPRLGLTVEVWLAVEDQDFVPVGEGVLLVVGQVLPERCAEGEDPELLLAAAEAE